MSMSESLAIKSASRIDILAYNGEVYTFEGVEEFEHDEGAGMFKVLSKDGRFTYIPRDALIMLTIVPAEDNEEAQIISLVDNK